MKNAVSADPDRSREATRLGRGDLEPVDEAAASRAVLLRTNEPFPGMVLMDLAMLEPEGAEPGRQEAEESDHVRLIILTALEDDPSLFEALKDEAQGYVLKGDAADRALALVQSPPRNGSGAVHSPSRSARKSSPDDLTDRETEVLQLMVNGVTSNRRLANQLGVSENTVKFHVRNILDKLHLHSRAQAVGFALRTGLVEATVGPEPATSA